tara:strand:- start:505 stop:1368 length:864 start_codon:yes stop_codon:yes gene_type:complete
MGKNPNQPTEGKITGDVHKSRGRRHTMDSMIEAAIWFWIPLILVPIGIWLAVSGKAKNLGKVLSVSGFILVLISSWTVPSSDSTAAGHLLLSIMAPSLLLAYGIHGMVFGGNVPVGKLDNTARWSGSLAVIISIVIFCLMHWYNLTPIWRNGDVNPYWIVFWPTFLLFSTSLCSVASFALISFGDNRVSESIKLASLSVIMTGVALAAIIFDGYLTTAEDFRDYLWLAAADIIGTVVGVTAAIGAFAIVIWSYERSLPPPANSLPPSDEEIKHVVELATSHIGGEEE